MKFWKLPAALAAILLVFSCGSESSQKKVELADEPAAEAEMMAVELQGTEVEASCGQCQFGMDAPGCDLAIRHEGVAYFVNGSDINDHGDAHAGDGFCNSVRKATVDGKVVDGKFVATAFALMDKPE